MESKSNRKVCVTGGNGYIGSALVKSLLQQGYTVHTTLTNPGDESKVKLLKSFLGAEQRLHLFKADINNPQEFEKPIQGCIYVFHVAYPLQSNNAIEASVNAAKTIADACIRSGTVKRLVCTASVVSASPLKDDGSGYKMIVDETCWIPLHNLNISSSNHFLKEYTIAKTKSEQEILKIGEDNANGLEVVTIDCGLVGGAGCLPHPSGTVLVFISQIANNAPNFQVMSYLQELLGKVPIVHVEDVCRAHIFCAETPFVNGRFLCASAFVTTAEVAKYYHKKYPELNQEYLEEHGLDTKWGSTKLQDKGFTYKYSTEMILDDCLECAKGASLI